MTMSDSFGAMLSSARKASGLTQEEVAERVGVAQSTYSKWENGASEMQAVYIRPLAMALGLSVDDLVPHPVDQAPAVEPSDRIGLQLVRRVAAAVEERRLGPRQARVLLDLLDELAPDRAEK